MLLTSLSIALIACIFGFKQARQLKRTEDQLHLSRLNLDLLRANYKFNLRSYSSLVKLNDELGHANFDIHQELKELKVQTLFDKEELENHVLNVIEGLDLELEILLCQYPFQDLSKLNLVNLYINPKDN